MKTIYQPTEEELKEMGFETLHDRGRVHYCNPPIWYEKKQGIDFWVVGLHHPFYPTSKQQVLDLISLFSPAGTKQ